MAENISDLLLRKLQAHYGGTSTLNVYWRQYWADAAGGNNGGIPKVGDALVAHYSKTATENVADAAYRFWTAYV